MLLLDLMEARDPKKTYHFKEVKGKIESITVKLEGMESASYTKMAKRFKEIDDSLKALQDERNTMSDAIKKDITDKYFDAEDAVLTRIIETVSLTAQLGKTPKVSEKIDNDAVVNELLKLMPELKGQIEGLQKQFSSMPKPKSPSLSVKTNEGVSDVWEKLKAKAAAYYNSVMDWAKGYDKKLAKIKEMMKPVRQVQETIAMTKALATIGAKMTADKKQIPIKRFIKKLKDSGIPLADVKDVIKDLDGKDGDHVIKAAEILALPTVKKSANPQEFVHIAGLLEALENNPPKRPLKPKDGPQIGKVVITSKDPSKELHRGDWVKITGGEHKDHYGYLTGLTHLTDDAGERISKGPLSKRVTLKVDISETKTPNVVDVSPDDVKLEKKFHDNEHFGKVAEKGKSNLAKATAKIDQDSFVGSDGEKYSFFGKMHSPNVRWAGPSTGNPLKVDTEKPRTDADRKKSAEYLKNIEKLLGEFKTALGKVENGTNMKDKNETLKHGERIMDALKSFDQAVDKFNVIANTLNDAADKNDRDKFGKALMNLRSLCSVERDHNKFTKIKTTIPEFMSQARTLAAKGYDYMSWARDNAEKYHKRMGMSDKQKAAADKASARMKMRWME